MTRWPMSLECVVAPGATSEAVLTVPVLATRGVKGLRGWKTRRHGALGAGSEAVITVPALAPEHQRL